MVVIFFTNIIDTLRIITIILPGSPETGSSDGSVNWSVFDPNDSTILMTKVPSSSPTSAGRTWHRGRALLSNAMASFCPDTAAMLYS